MNKARKLISLLLAAVMLLGSAVIAVPAASTYTITVQGGLAKNGSAQVTSAAAGTTITLTAGNSTTGRQFYKWEVVSGNATVANAKSASTTFTMPSGNVQVRAIFKLASTVMPASDLAAMCINIADNYKTLYIMGCFGANMNASNKSRYTTNHSYNKQASRTAMINAASNDTFGFDCVCLIKGILWGWSGKIYSSGGYGGASYAANGVPDIGTEGIIGKCSGVSTTFNYSTMQVGELLWMNGHVGVYVGNKLGIECSPKWKNKVQWSSTNTAVSGYNQRNWTKHGLMPYVDYYADSNADVGQIPVTPDEPTPQPGTTRSFSVTVPSSSSLKGTTLNYSGGKRFDNSDNGYAAFQPNGANPQQAYKVTMDYVVNSVPTGSDNSVIVAMLASGKTMGYNFTTGKYFLAGGGGGWNGNPSSYIVQNDGTVASGGFYRFEYVVEANKLTLNVNGTTVATSTVSGAFTANDWFIFYPKNVNIDVVYTKMEYIGGASLSTGSGSNALNGFNGMSGAWSTSADTYKISFIAAASNNTYNVSVPSTASYAGSTANFSSALNFDSSKGDANNGCGYANIDPNPTKPYRLTMDYVINSQVTTDPYRNTDQGVIILMLGSGKTMGYNFTTGKYFIANGGGGWGGDPSDYVVQKAGTVTAGNYYRFEYVVEANKLTLLVNGTEVAAASVSGAFTSGQYCIFYPKHVNMDITYTKFEYIDGSGTPVVGVGSNAMGAFVGMNNGFTAYTAVTNNYTVNFNSVAVDNSVADTIAAINAIGTVKYKTNTTGYSKSGLSATFASNNGYSNQEYNDTTELNGDYIFTIDAKISAYDTSVKNGNGESLAFFGGYAQNFTAGYDFASQKWGVMNGGGLMDTANFTPDLAQSATFPIETGRVYTFSVKATTAGIYLYVDGQLVASTTAVKRVNGNYFIFYPRCCTAAFTNYSFTVGGKIVESDLTGASLIASTSWGRYGEAYGASAVTVSGSHYDDSNTAIIKAEALYAGLTSTQKSKVTNYSTLTAARSTYDQLQDSASVDMTKVNACISAINAIGTVTLNSGNAITNAETLYAALNAAEKAKVTNYSTLTAARTAYDALVAQNAKVQPVIDAINAIGTVQYWKADSTMSYKGSGFTGNFGENNGYSNFKINTVEAFDVGSEVTFLARIYDVDTSNNKKFWGISTNTVTLGYDFASGCFGVQACGSLVDTGVFSPTIKSKSFTLDPNRFYEIRFVLNTDCSAIYVDDQCVIYTEAIKKGAGEYLIFYPRCCKTDFAMVNWNFAGTDAYFDHKTGAALTSGTGDQGGVWAHTGAGYGTSTVSFSKTIALDSLNAIVAAETLYAALTSSEKQQVTNYSTLTAARKKYNDSITWRTAENGRIADADKAIEAIGLPITLNSASALTTAASKYSKVNASFNANVWNYSVYVGAKGEYDALKNVYDLIEAIGEVTEASEPKIVAAENAYAALGANSYGTKAQRQSRITNYSTLTAARTNYNSLVSSQTKIANCIAAIDAIGTVTLNSGDAITNAENLYAALTAAEKLQVTNYSTLTAARSTYNALVASQTKVNNVIAAINAIGTVTINSGDAITNAENLYAALTASEKSQVTNYSTLTAARSTYNALVASQTKVNNVIAAINAIGTVTINSGDAITNAENLYAALTASEKSQVTNYSTLTAARSTYNALVASQTKVNNVIAAINAIGTVTINSGDAIANAENLYKALTASEKSQVTNYAVLTAARAAYDALIAEDPNAPKLVVSDVTAAPGDQIAVTLSIENNPGIAGLSVKVVYDQSIVTLVSASNGELFSGFTKGLQYLFDESEDVTDDGVLMTLVFTVNSSAANGEYEIGAVIKEAVDIEMEDVVLGVSAGTLTVQTTASAPVAYGDANEDGSVTMKDIVLIRRYLANYDEGTGASNVEVGAGADANGDNTIAMKDIVLLRRYLANYDEETGSSSVVLGPQN